MLFWCCHVQSSRKIIHSNKISRLLIVFIMSTFVSLNISFWSKTIIKILFSLTKKTNFVDLQLLFIYDFLKLGNFRNSFFENNWLNTIQRVWKYNYNPIYVYHSKIQIFVDKNGNRHSDSFRKAASCMCTKIMHIYPCLGSTSTWAVHPNNRFLDRPINNFERLVFNKYLEQ